MSTLYELSEEYLTLLQMLEDTEDSQIVIDTLEGIEGELEIKAENYAKVMRSIEGDIASIDSEIERLKKRKATMQNNVDSLKKHLQSVMLTTGKTKFKTELFSFNIQKNGGKRPVIWDVPVEEIPDDFVKIERKPDNEKIYKFIEELGGCVYAHLGERGESLRIK